MIFDAKMLVVDDDQMMLDFALGILASLGYESASAPDAAAALDLLERDPTIRAIMIDLRLGVAKNGAQLAREALAIRPELRVILTSGDPGSLRIAGQNMPQAVDLLRKPYRRSDLAARLTGVL